MRFRTIALVAMLGLGGCQVEDPSGNEAKTAGNVLDEIYANAGQSANETSESRDNVVEDPVAMAEDFSNSQSLDSWVGRWTGVEGTYLVVSRAGAGHYRLEMQYTLDDKGSFEGIGAGDGISFTRPDGAYVLRAATGDATGLKYLAGKTDCLKVKDGEGYCRD